MVKDSLIADTFQRAGGVLVMEHLYTNHEAWSPLEAQPLYRCTGSSDSAFGMFRQTGTMDVGG